MTDPTPVPSPEPAAAPPPAGGWAAPPVEAGPTGFVYADVPNRAIAYIIDSILVGIVVGIITGILGGMGFAAVTIEPTTLAVEVSIVGVIVSSIVGIVLSAAYFIYTWTSMRGTIGMRVLSMQIGNAGDGKTLTTDQAMRRWLAIAAPSLLAQVLIVIPVIGLVLALASIGWFIYLVYTTATSPTKQGFHDKFANTMVVKAGRSVA